MRNADIAAIFDEIADLLEIEEANVFRVRAYRNGARIVRDLNRDLAEMVAKGEDLTKLAGIGKDLAAQIAEIVRTGSSSKLTELHKEVPHELTMLLSLPGLGPKRVKTLYTNLEIHNLDELKRALQDGRIRELPGFGLETEKRLMRVIEEKTQTSRRFRLDIAAQYAEALIAYLQKAPGVKQAQVAGSYRRRKDTVGDLDILVTTTRPEQVVEQFVNYSEVKDVLAHGTTRATVILESGIQVDLRVVDKECFGAALQYFTGSKAHNVAVRKLGQDAGLKINEYGVFRSEKRVAGDTEESVYAALGLSYIAPELREDRGEIEAAQREELPHLVELSDLRGDLHSHTTATDGRHSLSEMAEAARQLGHQYLAITDHSKRLTVARGLDEKRLLVHLKDIDRLNKTLKGITLLKGIEVDILEDGSLDLPDGALAQLDVVVASVHSHFQLSRDKQTERIIKAMSNPYVTMLGHPSGRLVLKREAYDVDLERIIKAALELGCFLELDGHPERLDLIDVYCRMARDYGVLVSINSDAHSTYELSNLRFGIGMARRGWLTRKDVLNTRSLSELNKAIAQARKRRQQVASLTG